MHLEVIAEERHHYETLKQCQLIQRFPSVLKDKAAIGYPLTNLLLSIKTSPRQDVIFLTPMFLGIKMICIHGNTFLRPLRSCGQPRNFGSWCSPWLSSQTSSGCTATRWNLSICKLEQNHVPRFDQIPCAYPVLRQTYLSHQAMAWLVTVTKLTFLPEAANKAESHQAQDDPPLPMLSWTAHKDQRSLEA